MLTRIALTAVFAAVWYFAAIWFFAITKDSMRVASTLVTRKPGVDDEVLNETHRLGMGLQIDGFKLIWYLFLVLGVAYLLYRTYIGYQVDIITAKVLPGGGASGVMIPDSGVIVVSDSMLIGLMVVVCMFLWMPRVGRGAVLIDKASLRVPCFRKVAVYDRDNLGTSVWIQRGGKQTYLCIVSDGDRSSLLCLNERSAKILRIWAAGAAGDRGA